MVSNNKSKNENKARKNFVENYIENKNTKELKELEKSLKTVIVDRKNIPLSAKDKKVLEQHKAELKIVKEALSKDKKLEKLIAEVEKEAYDQTYRILTRHFPFSNVPLIKDETKPLSDKVGFYPEQDTDFRISLRGGELEDYYNVDEDELHEKLLSGAITPEKAGEAVATLYISKVLNTMINYDLKDNDAWYSSRLHYSIESGNWE